jgi:hypothetical protein
MIASLLQAIGILTVAVGVGIWSTPAGVVVVGLGLLAFGLAAERRG